MEVLHVRCAGLDVHKDTVVACARLVEGRSVEHRLRSFSTKTCGLLALSDWLVEQGCTHVAMEATGVYWKPVWHILEGNFELVLANAAHIKNVPGRKTDASDAEWISDLLAHGLVRSSFVPPAPVQEMRDLTRTRKQLVRESTRHVQRIQKTLEDANIKLAGTISDILGVGGRAILEALVEGESDPDKLAELAPRVKANRAELVEALRGRVTRHHRFLLRLHLGQIDALRAGIDALEAELGQILEPFRDAVKLLMTIPGVSDTVANVIVSEIGIDMSRFPSAGHLLSWAGMCPRNDESAGKRRSNRLRHASGWLKTALVQAAWAATRKKGCYLQAQFHRIRSRRGSKKAAVAVAASILTAAYHMLRDGTEYKDLGGNFFDRHNQAKTASRLLKRLRNMGYDVQIQPAA
jgi:transposase